MRFVELFAGIGGFSLGFERAGMTCVGHVEINPYAQKVLLKHWPKVPLLADVTKIKGDEFGEVDLLCGGFPCQDLSVAGKQKGIHGERSGLFDEIIRIARVCRPQFIVLENVANLLSRCDWFGYVLGRLAQIGYDADWEIISASDVGAPHLRKRIWIVAYSQSERGERGEARVQWLDSQRREGISGRSDSGESKLADTNSQRLQKERPKQQAAGLTRKGATLANTRCQHEPRNPEGLETDSTIGTASKLHTEPSSKGFFSDTDEQGLERKVSERLRPRESGLPSQCSQWSVEPNVCRVVDGLPNRMDRLKCLGNALVPQIAEFIGRQIMIAENK